ncbi:MAG TPA: NosD domain-containing protein [Candidatus Binatia bacterium]|nr:NosD domain-containing protein [Candidatus Binatia bacterium]
MKEPVVVFLILLMIGSYSTAIPVKAQSKTLAVPDSYSTIQAAIDNARTGDKITVKAGNYNENVVIDKPLSLIGEGSERTTISGNGSVGVLIRSDNVVLSGFRIIMFKNVWYWYGVHLLSVKNCNVYNNAIWNAYYGVWLYSSSSNNVYQNEFKNNGYGLTVDHSSNNTIAKNTITNSNLGGILNTGSSDNKIVGNNFLANEVGININGWSGPPSSQNNLVYGNIIMQSTYESIGIHSASYNNVTANTITGGVGIEGRGGEGILLEDASQNLINGNIMTSNRIGMRIEACSNTITENSIENNFAIGIANYYKFPAPSDNKIFGNNIINNNVTLQFTGINQWDNNSRGNFWSAYQGQDSNGDGIGDTPYILNGMLTDNYPLMVPIAVPAVRVDLASWVPVLSLDSFSVLDKTPPSVGVLTLNNQTFLSGNLSLVFTTNESTIWTGYSLDGQSNITLIGNATLFNLPNGQHNITVYAKDEVGNVGFETSDFSVATLSDAENYSLLPVIIVALGLAVIAVSIVSLMWIKRRSGTVWQG